jgi:hypothetical protein
MTPEERRLVEHMMERWGERMDADVAKAPPIPPDTAARISALLSGGSHERQRP